MAMRRRMREMGTVYCDEQIKIGSIEGTLIKFNSQEATIELADGEVIELPTSSVLGEM